MSNKIWNEPNMKPKAFANADGGNGKGLWGQPTVQPQAFSNSADARVVHTSGNVGSNINSCGALVSKYQQLHADFTKAADMASKNAIGGQMRAILNEMHSAGCGEKSNTASFTGCGTAIASAPTGAPDLTSKCAGGVYYTWCSGAFQPRTCQSSPYTGGKTSAWSNPNGAMICALSMASMVQSSPVGNPVSSGMSSNTPACMTSVCTPSPVLSGTKTNVFNTSTPTCSCGKTDSFAIGVPAASAPSCAPASAAVTPPVATPPPAPAPYVKPTFWQWLSRGMKA